MILDEIIDILNNKDSVDYEILKSKIIQFKDQYVTLAFEKNQIEIQYNKVANSQKSLEDAILNDQIVIYRLQILSIFSVIGCLILLINKFKK